MTTRRGLIQSLLLATILAAGAGIAWLAALGISMWVVDALIPERYEVRENLHIVGNDMPAIQSSPDGVWLDMNRKPFLKPPVCNSPLLQAPIPPDNKSNWWSRCKPLNIGGQSPVWFFVHDGEIAGHGYCVGYDGATKLPVQYVGRNGFRTQKPSREEQFPGSNAKMTHNRALTGDFFDSQALRYNDDFERSDFTSFPKCRAFLSSDEGLIVIDFARQTVRFLWKGSDLISTAATDKDPMAAEKKLHHELKQLSPLVLVRTSDRVLGIDSDGRELERYVIPPKLRNEMLEWHRLADGRVLVHPFRYGLNDNELFWIDVTGKIVRHEKVDLRVTTEAFRPWPMRIMRFVFDTLGFYLPSPGVLVGSAAYSAWADMASGNTRYTSSGYCAALWKALCKEWQALLANFVLGVILAIFCFRHQRKNGLPWTWAWVTFTLLFGLPAYLGYRFHRDWPVRLPCPHCGRPSPQDRAACCLCGCEFPKPDMKGIEVFA